MPTCVECGAAVSSLYTEYSKGNIRLTYCVNAHILPFLSASFFRHLTPTLVLATRHRNHFFFFFFVLTFSFFLFLQEHCKKLADKYVEHDFVIIFVDMILHKKPVYRHLLFNRLPYRDLGIDVSFTRHFCFCGICAFNVRLGRM